MVESRGERRSGRGIPGLDGLLGRQHRRPATTYRVSRGISLRSPFPLSTVLELLRLPSVRLEMSGDQACRQLFEAFTRRHARWRIIQSHRWGVALLRLPVSYEDYLKGRERAHLRRELNRALRTGYSFAELNALDRLDEILAINRSADTRQGRPMHPAYLDEAKVRLNLERSERVYGVLDSSGVAKAYLCLRTCGEVASVERLLGHADALPHGVMWVLLAGTIQTLIRQRATDGRPTWFMYDMFPGASDGMRQFKHWIGCVPYRVTWRWSERAPLHSSD